MTELRVAAGRSRTAPWIVLSLLLAVGAGAEVESVVGSLDTGFGTLGKTTVDFSALGATQATASSVHVVAGGKIVIVGTVKNASGDDDWALARLLPSGALDTTFASPNGMVLVGFDLGGDLEDIAHASALQTDGKIVVAGHARTDPVGKDFAIARFLPDGALDDTFDTDGKVTVHFDFGGDLIDVALAVAIQLDGKIVIAGYCSTSASNLDMALVRLNTNGSLDNTFDATGKTTVWFDLGGNHTDSAQDVTIQPDGKIVVAGYAEVDPIDYDVAVARLLTTGALDPSFDVDGKVTIIPDPSGNGYDFATAVAIQPDNKILVAGSTQISGADYDMAVARLTTGGSPDTNFGTAGVARVHFDVGGDLDDRGNALALLPNGKIMLAGLAKSVDPFDYDMAVARLQTTGSLDNGFDGDGRAVVPFDLGHDDYDSAQHLAIQADEKIVIAGPVAIPPSTSTVGVARLHGSGIFTDGFESGDVTAWSGSIP